MTILLMRHRILQDASHGGKKDGKSEFSGQPAVELAKINRRFVL